jgi:CMP-N-acetylneuraminic acid synthetase
MRRLAIIPARAGSKRIKNKNIVDFLGKPLISYSLEAVSTSGLFECVHVSTDSSQIAAVSASLGFPVDFMRPENLSDDFTALLPVLQWVVSEYESIGLFFDTVTCVFPTAPLLLAEDLVSANAHFENCECKYPLLSFSEYPVPLEWAFRDLGQGVCCPINQEMLSARSQDLPPAYYETGCFAIYSIDHLRPDSLSFLRTLAHFMPRERSVDIDTPSDLEYAKRLYLALMSGSPDGGDES